MVYIYGSSVYSILHYDYPPSLSASGNRMVVHVRMEKADDFMLLVPDTP